MLAILTYIHFQKMKRLLLDSPWQGGVIDQDTFQKFLLIWINWCGRGLAWKIGGAQKIVHAASFPGRENPDPSWPRWESELAGSLGLRIQRFPQGSSNFRATAAANLAQIWPPPSPACRLIILFIGGAIVAAALINRGGVWSKTLVRVRAKSFSNDLFVVWSVC